MIPITKRINEDGTVIFECSFKNDSGDYVTPNIIQWSLLDLDGNIINDRDWVSVSVNSIVNICLSLNDLAYTPGTSPKRRIIIYWVYSSDIVSNKPEYEEYEFTITEISYTKRD